MAGFSEAAVLRHILQGTATATGSRFFSALVQSLSKAVNTHMAWVTEYLEEDDSLNAIAFTTGETLRTNYRYRLKGTPCERVIRGASLVYHADDVLEEYPDDTDLKDFGIRSYLGVPLLDADGSVLGHLAVMDKRPMPETPAGLGVFQIFASRAAAELRRMRAEKEQHRLKNLLQKAHEALSESEQRFRDLFEEAPIAYVHENLDSRWIRANRSALRMLGIRPEEVHGTYGKSLVPNTPEAHERIERALASIRRGEHTSEVILELRRKDNGEPIWIQWWSSPAPDGSYTRTMFIDITDRVVLNRKNQLLEAQNRYLQEELCRPHAAELIGESERMKQVIEDLARVAPIDTTVLYSAKRVRARSLRPVQFMLRALGAQNRSSR